MFRIGTPRVLDPRTAAQVAELGRLEELGFRCMRALDEKVAQLDMGQNLAVFIHPKKGIIAEFIRLQRAIRQAIILQRELQGLRPPRVIRPPRVRRAECEDDAEDDLRERPDTATERDRPDARDDWDRLDYQPADAAARWIRQALGAEPPERDPLTPPDSGLADSGLAESGPAGPAPESPPPSLAPTTPSWQPAARSGKPAPTGKTRATLFRTTHFSPPAPIMAHPGIPHPAPAPWQPPRSPP